MYDSRLDFKISPNKNMEMLKSPKQVPDWRPKVPDEEIFFPFNQPVKKVIPVKSMKVLEEIQEKPNHYIPLTRNPYTRYYIKDRNNSYEKKVKTSAVD